MFRRSIFGSGLQPEFYMRAYRALGSASDRALHTLSPIPKIPSAFSGLRKNPITDGRATLPYALTFINSIHSGKPAEDELGGTAPRSMDYVQGLFNDNRNDLNRRPPLFSQPPLPDSFQGILQERGNNSFNARSPMFQQQLESNADIVHIKLMRNNAFVTLTDSKGNKKVGVSAGQLAGKGGKLNRYSGEAAAENIGRRVRQMKTRSVVVKVNGFTFFRRKKDAILSFKDGYSNSRVGVNPIVYLEDTTRKPHNGCRLPKKRRI